MIFSNTTVYTTTFAGRSFFSYFAEGIQTAITEVEFNNLVANGARIVNTTP